MPESGVPTKIGGGKFEVEKKLGKGCFGEVHRGLDTTTKKQVAIKFEDLQGHALQLEHEVEVLRLLSKPTRQQGFAECYYWGKEGRFHCLVMDLLGRSLEDRMQSCKGKLTYQTVVLMAEQLLCRIEYLHSKGLIHRDIKPENFMFGVKDKMHHVYLIDFGLSKRYWDSNNKHVKQRSKLSLTGTARYASVNAHRGLEQSRRDDLEAIGHMMMYFLRGSLPWSGLDAKTQEEKYKKIRQKKEEVKLDDLCHDHPEAFKVYLDTTRSLEFTERPDYESLRKLFRAVRAQHPELQDHSYQWMQGGKVSADELTPLEPWEGCRQPDDTVRESLSMDNGEKGRTTSNASGGIIARLGKLCCSGGKPSGD